MEPNQYQTGMSKTNNRVFSSEVETNASACSAKRALVNVILRGGYFARVSREEMEDLRDNHELIAVEG